MSNDKIIYYTLLILIISMFTIIMLLFIYMKKVEEANAAISHLEQIIIDMKG